MVMYISTLFVVTVLTGTSLAQPVRNAESRLMQHILKDYDPNIRPVANVSHLVNVTVGINLQQIIRVDFHHEMLTLLVWIRKYWKDESIKWKPEDFDGLKSVVLNYRKIWVPDITLYNSVLQKPEDIKLKMLDNVVANHAGEIKWTSPIITASKCKMDVASFPFDKQRCHLELGSWAYDGGKLDVQVQFPYVDNESYSQNEEWLFYDSKAEKERIKFHCCPDPWPSVLFTIFIKRRPTFFMLNLIVPCGLITVLSIFSFFLPPSSGERVSFIMTVLVAYSVYMMIVAEEMPHSAEAPLASKFFVFIMVQQAISLAATCFILRFHNNCRPIPKLFAVLVNKWLARLVWMSSEKNSIAPCEEKRDKLLVKRSYRNSGFKNEDYDLAQEKANDESPQRNDNVDLQPNEKDDAETELRKLSREVKVISDQFRKNSAKEVLQDDWMFATQVLDRFFIIFLGVSVFICMLIIVLYNYDVLE